MHRKGVEFAMIGVLVLVLVAGGIVSYGVVSSSEGSREAADTAGDQIGQQSGDVKDTIQEAVEGVGDIEHTITGTSSGVGTASPFSGSMGPPNKENWDVVFADDFEGGSLDTEKWEVGFGWGMDTSASYERISPDEVSVSNGELVLGVSHNGGPGSVTAGSVHTKGKHYWEPPVFFEAALRTPDRHGLLPAFWAKSNKPTPNWPPEIDFFEMLGNNPSSSHHNIHYDGSGGMGGNHRSDKMSYGGIESTTDWHVYGSAWYEDRIEMYVDGEHVGTHDNPTAMRSMMAGAPFYIMLNIHVGKTGQPDFSESWDDTMHVDGVQVWKPK